MSIESDPIRLDSDVKDDVSNQIGSDIDDDESDRIKSDAWKASDLI